MHAACCAENTLDCSDIFYTKKLTSEQKGWCNGRALRVSRIRLVCVAIYYLGCICPNVGHLPSFPDICPRT